MNASRCDVDQRIRPDHFEKPGLRARAEKSRPGCATSSHQVEIGCSLTRSTKNISRPADFHRRAGLHHVRDRRQLQLVAPAIDIREQTAGCFREGNDRDIRFFPLGVADEETALAKTGGRLFLPTRRALSNAPPARRRRAFCAACCGMAGVGGLLRDAIDRDLVVASVATGAGQERGGDRGPA